MGLRERKRAQLLARIQAVTLALIRQDGFESVTVDAIVREVEISPPTFYKHFCGKEEVLRSIASELLQTAWVEWRGDAHAGTLTNQLQALFAALPAWIESDKALWRAMVLADALNPFRWPEQREKSIALLAWLQQQIATAQAAGELSGHFSAEFITHSLISIQSMTLLDWAVSEWPDHELSKRLQEGVTFVISAARRD